nr:EOG090X08PA [Lepidurus arcticus]
MIMRGGPNVRIPQLLLLGTILVLCLSWLTAEAVKNVVPEDNDFAEFEDLEEDWEAAKTEDVEEKLSPLEAAIPLSVGDDDEEITVEDEESEFEHLKDEEEFEGFDGEKPTAGKNQEGPKITFAKVPMHLRSNWESYWLELIVLSGIVIYFLNFFTGRARNQKIAQAWFTAHKTILEDNFALVGDDGHLENPQGGLMKESDHTYVLWCSGRVGCSGMLVELRLLKRQDIVTMVYNLIRPTTDQLRITVYMNPEEMDNYVFCLAQKKTAAKLVKELADLGAFCPEKKSVEKFCLPANFALHSEIGEAATALVDTRVTSVINKFPDMVDSIHFSDQYTGPKQTEEVLLSKMPSPKKVLIFTSNLSLKSGSLDESMEQCRPFLQMVLYCIDRVKKFRLSKEAKVKAEKNRLKAEEAFLKSTHAARVEAAAVKREEKRRTEKEKILLEEDPEKQRRWEDKEAKRAAKKRLPKMKQLKVKLTIFLVDLFTS